MPKNKIFFKSGELDQRQHHLIDFVSLVVHEELLDSLSGLSSIFCRPAVAFLLAKTNTGVLNFLVWQKPRERLIVKVDHINPIIERVAESTPKSRDQL